MQRRVAAIYFVFFVVMGASAYSVIALAGPPQVTAPGERLSSGDSITVDGTQYTATNVSAVPADGETTYYGRLTWTEQNYEFSATLANNSTVQGSATPPPNGTYRVLIDNVSDPGEFTLREQHNVSAILAADPAVENETITRADGERYVVFQANGSTRLLADYLPPRETYTYEEGTDFEYQGNATTVANVTTEAATLTWTGDRPRSTEIPNEGNVTLSGQTYTAYYTSQDTVLLTAAYDAYQHDLRRIDYYHERIAGLWAVLEISAIAALLIISLAYMPIRG